MTDELKDFEEMQVRMDCKLLAKEIYQSFSNCSDYSFVDQIKRASVSISNNIAEDAERSSSIEFARFLDIAKGSCGEVRSMLRLGASCTDISKQLGGFSKYLRNKN